MSKFLAAEQIQHKIYFIRGLKVMLDKDLASLYGVLTKNLNKAVTRNLERFPADFMIQLTKEEYDSLRFQIGTLKKGEHSKYLPYAFTEQGVAMLSSVLRSRRAIEANIVIMRAFVRLRQVLAPHKELANRLSEIERRMDRKDREIIALFEEIRKLMAPPPVKKKPFIGFHP